MSKTIPDLTWWNYLNWNVSKCVLSNEQKTAWWTTACNSPSYRAFGAIGWIVTGILVIVFLLIIVILCYAIFSYRYENRSLIKKVYDTEKALRSQNEYFTAKLHAKLEDQIKVGEKHAEELRKQQEAMQAQNLELQRHFQKSTKLASSSAQSQPIIIPYYREFPSVVQEGVSQQPQRHHTTYIESKETPKNTDSYDIADTVASHPLKELQIKDNQTHGNPTSITVKMKPKNDGTTIPDNDDNDMDKLNETLNTSKKFHDAATNRKDKREISILDLNGSSSEKLWRSENPSLIEEEEGSEITTDSGFSASAGHLPPDHPARTLPPIDIMFLVDSSSSIGITNFDIIKSNIVRILDDIDIAPGRSRVSVVQYAQQPSVVFGFDKYYSISSVKKGVMRMSYTGGATMLAKALSFAAGLLYREQNLKQGKRRKHKLMPTPRHDRLQVLCILSDGASEDNIDKAASNLHDKLQVKVFAMVTRSFNKEKLYPITKFEGSVFVMDQKESISIWLWRQQRLWIENYGVYFEKEKSIPLSSKQSPKKTPK